MELVPGTWQVLNKQERLLLLVTKQASTQNFSIGLADKWALTEITCHGSKCPFHMGRSLPISTCWSTLSIENRGQPDIFMCSTSENLKERLSSFLISSSKMQMSSRKKLTSDVQDKLDRTARK